MKTTGIYQIQSRLKPDRIYIGSAINIHKRWCTHAEKLRKNIHHSKKLQRHYNKYGQADLEYSVVLGCEKEELIKTEQYFLDSYRPYFNTSMTAGSTLGTKLTEEHRKKLSESHKGHIPTDEQRKKIGDAHRGKKRPVEVGKKIVETRRANGSYIVSDETKRKISESQIGKKKSKRPNWNHVPWNKGKNGVYSKETIQKLRDSHKGKKMPEEQRMKMIGRKASEETKAKMRASMTGEKNTNFGKKASEEIRKKQSLSHKGKPTWNKGKHWSEEQRRKIGERQIGRIPWNKGKKGYKSKTKNITLEEINLN